MELQSRPEALAVELARHQVGGRGLLASGARGSAEICPPHKVKNRTRVPNAVKLCRSQPEQLGKNTK